MDVHVQIFSFLSRCHGAWNPAPRDLFLRVKLTLSGTSTLAKGEAGERSSSFLNLLSLVLYFQRGGWDGLFHHTLLHQPPHWFALRFLPGDFPQLITYYLLQETWFQSSAIPCSVTPMSDKVARVTSTVDEDSPLTLHSSGALAPFLCSPLKQKLWKIHLDQGCLAGQQQ